MSVDAWIVGFGLSRVLIELDLVQSAWAYSVMAAAILIDLCLLYLFLTTHSPIWSERRSRRTADISG